MINVKSPPSGTGAMGDGTTDDKNALQAMIDNELGALYFPPGRYRINSTLVFPNRTGYHIVGCGLAERVPFSSAAKGCESVLVWGGTATNVPMVEIRGQGLCWNGLGLWGCNWPGSSSSCPNSPAGTGILIKRPSSSDPLATGKIWFGSLLVEDCATAVATASNTDNVADQVAFGYFWPRGCQTALHLNHAKSTAYSFEYVHAEDCGTVFKVTNGGRVFTQAVRVLSDDTIVLDLVGGDATNAYYHLNGVALDDDVDGVMLLKNVSSSNGTHHVRFTNAHLICSDTSPCPPSSSSAGTSGNCHPVEIQIDRTGSTEGQTMLELDGCRGLAALYANVLIKGKSGSKPSYLIVRESEIGRADYLIDPDSSNHKYWGRENWTYPCGIVAGDNGP